jgi:hypothetical protein
MEFTLYGFDVYTAEVDDKGIDFVIRKERRRGTDIEFVYYDVQVKFQEVKVIYTPYRYVLPLLPEGEI